jgi:hypothetical protein
MQNHGQLVTSRPIAAMSRDHVSSNTLLTLSLKLTESIKLYATSFCFCF